MYIFISHSSKDAQAAADVCNLLEQNNHTCFLSSRDIRIGQEYAEEIVAGIERSDAMLLLLSKEANESPHVLREIERAVSKKITIIVYKMEEVELSKSMEYFLMTHQWLNTSLGKGYEEIVDCVNELAGKAVVREKKEAVSSQNVQSTKETPGTKDVKALIGGVVLLALGLIVCLAIFAGLGISGVVEGNGGDGGQQEESVLSESIALGDTITFGTYNGEPIEWRVIQVSEDGSEAVIVSQHILTMKAYDAAEGGAFNFYEGKDYWTEDIADSDVEFQHLLRGNNAWESSNIRTWLNSEAENVTYEGQAPVATAMSSKVNGYDKEAGFLNGFTEEELAAIVTTTVQTGDVTTEDKVFLLSSEELDWFEAADVSLMATPTQAAIEQDKSDWYEGYSVSVGVEDYYWWLRDTATDAAPYKAYTVTNSYVKEQLELNSVGLEGYGIRPAMTVDLTEAVDAE